MILYNKNKTIVVTLSYFKMSFTLFINNLLTDQHSSQGMKPHMMFTVLDFLWGESVEILLVPHWTTIICTDDGSDKLMVCQSIFSTRSRPIPKFLAFSHTKYFFYTIWYRASSAMTDCPNRSLLGFVTFLMRQCLRWDLIQLDLSKRSRAIKAITNILKRKADFDISKSNA